MNLDLLISNIKEIYKNGDNFLTCKSKSKLTKLKWGSMQMKKKCLICVQTIKVCFFGGGNRIFKELELFKKRNLI